MPLLILSLGSNLGRNNSKDGRKYNLVRAIELLIKNGMTVECKSSIYETEPEGRVAQPKFLNMAVGIRTGLTPEFCRKTIHQIETDLGRMRKFKNEPRTIDLDIIFYDQLIVREDNLIIPHPRMHQRAFVLVPLAEILPDYRHPVYQKTVTELLKEIDTKGVSLWN
jgi:dihydroneopterin aldolase/2-amino-4-hydroxy-6-hydroxymethyldihydropteridine diphosphokinase